MNKFLKIFSFATCIIYLCLLTQIAKAQEQLVPLRLNPVLAQKAYNAQSSGRNSTKGAHKTMGIYPNTIRTLKIDTLNLPFLDDFSKPYYFPDSTKWVDRNVFINSTFPIAPPSIGVATFDGLDSTGFPYQFVPEGNVAGNADHLTSFPINLYNYLGGSGNGPWINYSALDSVYFSFFYQAGGRGNYPAPPDSLVLEFLHCFIDTVPTSDSTYRLADTCIWQWQWSKAGYTPLPPDTGFHPVIIHVDPMFYQPNFQFRFRNYAHLNGNLDQWNLDYVYLNRNRNCKDTIFSDVAFAYNTSSILRNYTQMPWEQYIPSELCDSVAADTVNTLRTFICNDDTVAKNTYFNYQLLDKNANPLSNYGPFSINIQPFNTGGYCNYSPFEKPPLNYKIPTMTDSTLYIVKSFVHAVPDFDNFNDTVLHYQPFYNAYAYDDGTAEMGYYLSGYYPSLAMSFKLNFPDTLKAIQIYFNPIIDDAQLYFFRLGVWADNNGSPGKLIYKDSVVSPIYGDTIVGGFNQFTTYRLTNKSFVLPAGVFYIGWMQLSSDPLNVGFDCNTNADQHTFINVSGYWQPSILPGTVMMRPLFRGYFPSLTGIASIQKPSLGVAMYPNPTSSTLQITVNNPDAIQGNYQVELNDLLGQRIAVLQEKSPVQLNLENVSPGIYFVKITDLNTQQSAVERVIKN